MENKRGTYGNATNPQITPIEMNLAPEWQQQKVLYGKLHSKYERVQNYLFTVDGENRMLTIMCEGNTLLPDSIILCQEDYEAIKGQGELQMGKLKDCKNISSCSLLELSTDKFREECFAQRKEQIKDFIENSEKKSDFERLPRRYTDYLEAFQKTLWEDPAQILPAFLKLAGAGRGLTPAADDAMIGMMAGYLFRLSMEKKAQTYLKTMVPVLSCLCEEKMTTEVSLKYLKCACRGQFSQNLCRVVRSLIGELDEDIKPILEEIRKVGHSSGMDMLYGLDMMLQRG